MVDYCTPLLDPYTCSLIEVLLDYIVLFILWFTENAEMVRKKTGYFGIL